MAITINMGTLSKMRALLVSCLLMGLVIYTLSSALRPSHPPPAPGRAVVVEHTEEIPYGISVFEFDNYQKHLVVPKMRTEDVFWLTYFPPELLITVKPYLVDADRSNPPAGALTTPMNKGHEVMAYLTYIIDHYHSLPDIIIFAHAHAAAWHNNDLQLASTPVMILELNYHRVVRHGYMNLRCHWHPGCPTWINTSATIFEIKKEAYFRAAFRELFPNDIVPPTLGAACCAQFAVTRDTVRVHARERYVVWRRWVMETPLEDDVSGRVWEYLWQYVFPGPVRTASLETMAEACPEPHVCYCDGYGYCFGGEKEYKMHIARRVRAEDLRSRLRQAEEDETAVDSQSRREGMARVRAEIKGLDDECEAEVLQAKIRGKSEALRRKELGSEFSG